MLEIREFKCPSGAILKVAPSPFKDAKALYQAILKEARAIPVSSNMDVAGLFKDLFCAGFSSPEIEKCLEACLKRCLYNDLKIDTSTFEPVESREDYMAVCMEVAKENVLPFVKSLYAEYLQLMKQQTESIPK